jgi:P27 family predicted phage terminase small subunit
VTKQRTGRPTGRPAQPVERLRARGSAVTPAPVPGDALPATAEDLEPPEHLGDAGRERWDLVWRAGRSWLSPDVDRPVVVMLCEATDEAAVIAAGLRDGTQPRTYEMSNGAVVTHPAVTQLREYRTQCTTWLAMLGFSPSDRARLGLAEVRVRDELDELQRRRADRRRAASDVEPG